MREYNSPCDLASYLKSKSSKRIGVDGRNGVRKSTLAGALCMELGLQLVSLDNFLVKDQGGYIEFLRYDDLAECLCRYSAFVIEGICLLQALEKVSVELDDHVYVKRYHLDLWADERELLVPQDSVEEFLDKERELAALMSGSESNKGPSLSDDIIRYHARYRPQERADYIYKWDERNREW